MELKTRKRIVGFILLIALGFILIPLFLGRSITSDAELSDHVQTLSIPDKEVTMPKVEPTPVPQSVPSSEPSSGVSKIVFEQLPITPESTSEPEVVLDEPEPMPKTMSVPTLEKKPVSEPKPALEAKPVSTPKPAKKAATEKVKISSTPESWVVQVGSFSSKANAEALMKKIQAGGFPAYLLTSSNSSQVRVLVGPEILKSSANKMKSKLSNALGIEGIVVQAGK